MRQRRSGQWYMYWNSLFDWSIIATPNNSLFLRARSINIYMRNFFVPFTSKAISNITENMLHKCFYILLYLSRSIYTMYYIPWPAAQSRVRCLLYRNDFLCQRPPHATPAACPPSCSFSPSLCSLCLRLCCKQKKKTKYRSEKQSHKAGDR